VPRHFGIKNAESRPVLLEWSFSKERVIAKTQQNTIQKKIREQEARQKANDKLAKRQDKRDAKRD